jgi:hypothetical protein
MGAKTQNHSPFFVVVGGRPPSDMRIGYRRLRLPRTNLRFRRMAVRRLPPDGREEASARREFRPLRPVGSTRGLDRARAIPKPSLVREYWLRLAYPGVNWCRPWVPMLAIGPDQLKH